MSRWSFTPVDGAVGRFQIVVYKVGGRPQDVTYFRNAAASIQNYSNADPFGDSVCVLDFPQITGFDDLASSDVGSWLAPFSQVELYWVASVAGTTEMDPRTNQRTLGPGVRTKIWEGYVASLDMSLDTSGSKMSVQCQGSLFQVDRYMAKPAFPPRPIPHETLIARAFDHKDRPHLRTKPLKIEWPVGWTKKTPPYTKPTAYTPDARPGVLYSGYSTRDTGGWVHALTDHVAGLTRVMFTDDDSGVSAGNQWTVRSDPGRQPVLYVRNRYRTPDIELWFGQVGVTGNFSLDATQVGNIVYGTGTAIDGSGWSNQVISNDGRSTGYAPLAAARNVYPQSRNPFYNKNAFAAETKREFMSGFALDQAISSAQKSLQREAEAAWTGDLTLSVDPSSMSRWMIRSDMTLKLMGFAGTGATGLNFHIAQVQANPEAGTVQLTIDSRYRDLTDLEEIRLRQRDPLTPTKMLRVGARSVVLEDISAPWDYTAGSGFIPLNSVKLHSVRPTSEDFPWKSFLLAHPPRHYGHWYVRVKANAALRADRWTLGRDVPILMAQKGSIRRTEIVCVDVEGNIVPVPFHFSMYYMAVVVSAMPRDAGGPSPFLVNAFESIDKTGMQLPPTITGQPPAVGWGNADQPAGYSPGRKSDGTPPTGILVDEANWNFDTTNNPNYAHEAKPGYTIPASVVTMYGAFYAEYTQPVYFIGRLFRQEPGT